jgi:hypothetical protein
MKVEHTYFIKKNNSQIVQFELSLSSMLVPMCFFLLLIK